MTGKGTTGGKRGARNARSARATQTTAKPTPSVLEVVAEPADVPVTESTVAESPAVVEAELIEAPVPQAHVSASEDKPTSIEEIGDVASQPDKKDKGDTAIQLHQPASLVGSPVMPSDLEIVSTMTVAGVRPVVASHLELFGSFLNGRPIEASHLTVAEMLPGGRPVFDDGFKLMEGVILPGDRPVMASDPALLTGSMLPGGRPIASNQTVDPEPAVLMGYLD